MENTTPLLFDDTNAKYFVALMGKAIGPLTAQDIYERMRTGEIGILHFFWCEGWPDWKRICDDREFATLIPQKPSSASIAKLREKLAKKKVPDAPEGEPKIYYLYFNSTQYGPFSRSELIHVLETHKPGRNAYLWVPGWSNWKRISEVKEFAEFAPPPEPKARKKTRGSMESIGPEMGTIGVRVSSHAGVDASDKRRGPRRPLVARLFVHNNEDVIIAVCRDISVGGMQVLTDRIPGPVGSTIKLNVSPGDPKKVKGFVAEGEIVRVLEDGRGFSFRFRKISAEARKTIEKYIQSDD